MTSPADTPAQAAARAWLARPDIEARIKAVANAEYARQLRAITAHRRWSWPEKDRRASQLQARILRGMGLVMRTTAHIHARDGEAAALAFLETVEEFGDGVLAFLEAILPLEKSPSASPSRASCAWR